MTQNHSDNDKTWFLRLIQLFFKNCSRIICFCPWTCIILTTLSTLLLSLQIPFTPMKNDISDFTPFGARSRIELEKYRNFFTNKGEPKAIYAFISAKNNENMLGIRQLNETVQVLDKISRDFYLETNNGPKNFEEYCSGFCLLNEPVRHFYSGMILANEHGNNFSHLDLGYPITTVLGTKLYMDPNFFGVKWQSINEKNVSGVDQTVFNGNFKQIPNNIREISLIVLQFRSELGTETVLPSNLRLYERKILDYFHEEFFSSNIEVYILTDCFITEEIVRAGLTLLPFLIIGFTIMSLFSSFTFSVSAIYVNQMSIYKVILAIMACVTPFMACGFSLGAMFLVGFRFGSILCVTPFLVLAIGVDDAYLMMNAWQRITTQRRQKSIKYEENEEVLYRITEMFKETGPSITITTITNVLAFGIGATTPAAEIQLFCIGNALAVVIDFLFTITMYGALMVIVAKFDIHEEAQGMKKVSPRKIDEDPTKNEKTKQNIYTHSVNIICNLLTNSWICSIILGLLAVYWYFCILGALKIKSELSPSKLFLENSKIVEIFQQRKKFIIPHYSAFWILVENPGNINDPNERLKLERLVEAFESLPTSNGRYSTKFWLRDYEDFLKQSEEEPFDEDNDDEFSLESQTNQSHSSSFETFEKRNELREFLEWPEFAFWKGFIDCDTSNNSDELKISKFLVTTAYHGSELVEWSRRAKLLNELRNVADQFPSLNVSVYEEDAKFLDLIETMAPTAIQSALWTFASMFLVTALFITHPPTLFVATFSILSTSLGVFGIMSWWGVDLDPIMMSATVMSIGFSVDIPSHVSYHYYETGKQTSDVRKRLQLTIESVGFPILEASLSTSFCVISLFFVELNMAQVFAKCMLLVVLIGLFHGMIVMPVIFSLLQTFPQKLIHKTKKEIPLSSAIKVITSK